MSNPYQPPQQPYGQQPSQPPPQQPSYGQQPPYGQPTAPQQPTYGQQQPYGQPTPSYQPYGQQPGQAAQPYQQPSPPPKKKGGIMGVIGLVIVLAALIGGLVLAVQSVEPLVAIAQNYGNSNDFSNLPQDDPAVQALTVQFVIYLVVCLVGTVGWVLSIVATVRNATRPAGIAGIVLGVLALPIHVIVWFSLIGNAAESLM